MSLNLHYFALLESQFFIFASAGILLQQVKKGSLCDRADNNDIGSTSAAVMYICLLLSLSL